MRIVNDIGTLITFLFLCCRHPKKYTSPAAVQGALLADYLSSIALTGVGSIHIYGAGGSKEERIAEAYGSFSGR